MADPTQAHRLFAADARAMFTALTDEGFTGNQAVTLLCQIIANPPAANLHEEVRKAVAVYAADARHDRVAKLLGGGQQKSTTPSPVDDRASGLWNPPATEGAPAHE